MAFSLNFSATQGGAFAAAALRNGGQSGQGLPATAEAIANLLYPQTPAATPVSSVAYQAPNPTPAPVGFSLDAWIKKAKQNPVTTALVAGVALFAVWKLTR